MRTLLGVLALALAVVTAARGEWMPVGYPVPLRGDGTSWTVQATINGRTNALFLLDTGASYCVIAPSLARQLALPPTGSFATVLTAKSSPADVEKGLALGANHYITKPFSGQDLMRKLRLCLAERKMVSTDSPAVG